jgi:hypothetical protein
MELIKKLLISKINARRSKIQHEGEWFETIVPLLDGADDNLFHVKNFMKYRELAVRNIVC